MSLGYVYFIECGKGGPVKIGFAGSVEKRLEGLQTANPEPLNLLAALWTDDAYELELHQEFTAGRIRGEWFRRDTPGLNEAIEQASDLSQFAAKRGLLLTHGPTLVAPPRPVLREVVVRARKASV